LSSLGAASVVVVRDDELAEEGFLGIRLDVLGALKLSQSE
jgi:hypothetical protein